MKYAIFLRGINIGGRTLKSVDLKQCFEKAGFSGAQTVLATGNVLIESNENPERLKQTVEKMLESTFHFPVKVMVVNIKKLTEIVNNFPFQDAGPEFHRYVIFKDKQPDAAMLATIKLDGNLEVVQSGEHVIYWKVLKGRTLDSDFAKALAKTAAKNFSTTRNLNTLEKILAKL
jgi:uncharacterized protein (DUF1697 family)